MLLLLLLLGEPRRKRDREAQRKELFGQRRHATRFAVRKREARWRTDGRTDGGRERTVRWETEKALLSSSSLFPPLPHTRTRHVLLPLSGFPLLLPLSLSPQPQNEGSKIVHIARGAAGLSDV